MSIPVSGTPQLGGELAWAGSVIYPTSAGAAAQSLQFVTTACTTGASGWSPRCMEGGWAPPWPALKGKEEERQGTGKHALPHKEPRRRCERAGRPALGGSPSPVASSPGARPLVTCHFPRGFLGSVGGPTTFWVTFAETG